MSRRKKGLPSPPPPEQEGRRKMAGKKCKKTKKKKNPNKKIKNESSRRRGCGHIWKISPSWNEIHDMNSPETMCAAWKKNVFGWNYNEKREGEDMMHKSCSTNNVPIYNLFRTHQRENTHNWAKLNIHVHYLSIFTLFISLCFPGWRTLGEHQQQRGLQSSNFILPRENKLSTFLKGTHVGPSGRISNKMVLQAG